MDIFLYAQYESTERKRKEERELKERARMKEKEGANLVGGGLRREVWIHPGGKRMRRTTSASAANESRFGNSDLEDLTQLTSIEVCIQFMKQQRNSQIIIQRDLF